MATVSSGSSGGAMQTRRDSRRALRVGHAKFYTDPSTSFGDKVDQALDSAEPPSEGFGL